MIGSAALSGAFGPVSERICRRSRAYFRPPWKPTSAWARPCSAVPRRAVFMKVNMQFRPLFAGPIRKPVAPSKFITQVALPWMPILCSREPQDTALRAPTEPSAFGMNFGTMNREMPLVPAGASGRRASTMWTMLSAMSCSPAEMKILVPETL
ncbi:hypothetical protein D3C73_1088210 [compost metagenome]